MAERIDTITVTARLPSAGPSSSSIGALPGAQGGAFERLMSSPVQSTFERTSEFEKLLDKKPKTDFEKLLEKPTKIGKEVIDNITVIGRSPAFQVVSRALGSGVVTAASIGAFISDTVSQRRLDQAFADLMNQTSRRKPDSPLKTLTAPAGGDPPFPPQPTDELFVIGRRRPDRRTRIAPTPDLATLRIPVGPPNAFDTRVSAPRLPKVSEKTRLSTRTSPLGIDPSVDLFGVTFGTPGATLPATLTAPRGTPPPTSKPTRTTISSNPNLASLPQTQTAPARAGFCPPCPKPTRTKKKRTKCYRKLVKEHRDPRLDKEFRWAEIDCLTGKEK